MAKSRINPYDSTTVTGTSTGMVVLGEKNSRKKDKFRVEKPKRGKRPSRPGIGGGNGKPFWR